MCVSLPKMVEDLIMYLKGLISGQLGRMRVPLSSIYNLVLDFYENNRTVRPGANVD